MQALLAVPLGAVGIQDAHDHPAHLEAPLGDLAHHQVGVVAVCADDADVGALDARGLQRVHFESGADGEHAAGVVPGGGLVAVEPLLGERVLVQDRHLVALVEGPARDCGPHPARADDQHEHGPDSSGSARAGWW